MSPARVSHTPGPWKITCCMDYWVEHSQPITEADDGFRGVAHLGDVSWPNSVERQQEWEANARLIAEAPAMYEALKRSADLLDEMVEWTGNYELTAEIRAILARIEPKRATDGS